MITKIINNFFFFNSNKAFFWLSAVQITTDGKFKKSLSVKFTPPAPNEISLFLINFKVLSLLKL